MMSCIFCIINWRNKVEKLKSSSDYVKSLKEINLRIDDIEKLLQLLLVNNLVDDVANIVKVSEKCIEKNVSDAILKYGLEFKGYKTINDIEVIILEIPERTRISIKELKEICFIVKQCTSNIEPLFMYSKINGMQRKSIVREGISFGIKGKEIHVTKWEARI